MRRSVSLAAILLATATPALAQRAAENVVTAAGDAFGTSIGNERVGIYSPGSARGFSPIQAGNVRLEGLYFDLQRGLNDRLISGSSVRVGIAAQGYPFVAPTGVADFTLRKADDAAVLSTVLRYDSFGSVSLEADGQLPISETLSLAVGASISALEFHTGTDERVIEFALAPRWRPSPELEVMSFVSYEALLGNEAEPIYFTAGPYLPPNIERRRYFGPSWAQDDFRGMNYGLLATYQSGNWTLRGGGFRSEARVRRSYVELALDTSPEGVADRFIAADGDSRSGSSSGELRATRSIPDGERLHQIHLMVRGRDRQRFYGGGDLIPLGRRPIDEVAEIPDPRFEVGPQTRDEVRQLTAGIGYQGRWRNVGELNIDVQKTDYSKSVLTPSGPLPVSKDRPWLINAAGSIHASERLSFYAGYARGLEESPVAPTIARNRNEAPPAVMTEQNDIGLRLVLPRNLRLIAGLFDVRKPHYGLDSSLFFGRLGEVRHRGAEFSLSGSPLPGLTIVLGTMLLDAKISGTAVEQGLVGERPISTFARLTNGAIDYRLPFRPELSIDLSFESTSDRVADRLNTFDIPAREVFALGSRYRFKIGDTPATLRAQISNLANVYGWRHAGQGFEYIGERRLGLSLAVDW